MHRTVVALWAVGAVASTTLPAALAQAQGIKLGDDYFDRLMRSSIVEATPTPGHFAVNGKYADGGLLSTAILSETAIVQTDWVSLSGIFGLLWYRYEIEGLPKGTNAGGLNQALGAGVYLLPKAPVKLNLFGGYNYHYGANLPYGLVLPKGSPRPDFRGEMQPFFYATGSALDIFRGVASLMFRDGLSKRSKSYFSGVLSLRGWEVGATYDELASSANPDFVAGGNAPKFYESSFLLKKTFGVGGALDGYMLAKAGRSFFVDSTTTFNREWAKPRNVFGLLELSYYWVLGLSYSKAYGMGWRAGVNYGLPWKKDEGDASGWNAIDGTGKSVYIQATYQRSYVDSDLFGPRVVPWTATFGIALR